MYEKILVVDDIEDIRSLLQEALQANGYQFWRRLTGMKL